MKQTVIFFATVITLIIVWLIGFVNDLNDEVNVSHGYNEKSMITKERTPMSINVDGNDVLLLSKLTLHEKKRIWNNSDTKIEMLELFPNFSEMKLLLEEDLEDDGTFKDALLSNLEHIEFKYVGGVLNTEGAKKALRNF